MKKIFLFFVVILTMPLITFSENANETLKQFQATLKEKKAADIQKDGERTAAQKTKRDERITKAQASFDSAKGRFKATPSAISNIKMIEDQKKSIVEIWNDAERRAKSQATGTDEKANEEIREKIFNEAFEKVKPIFTKLQNDYNLLRKTYTASSLSGEVLYKVASYDKSKYRWNLDLCFVIDGVCLGSQKIQLDYMDVTGLDFLAQTSKAYNEEVDLWTSLFDRAVPIYIFECDYTVKIAPANQPSQYSFTINNLYVKDPSSGRVLITEQPFSTPTTVPFSPAYDISMMDKYKAKIEQQENLRKAAEAKAKQEKEAAEAKAKREKEEAEAKEKKLAKNEVFDQKQGHGGMTGLRIGMIACGDGAGFDAKFLYGWPYVFLGASLGMKPTPGAVKNLVKDNMFAYGGVVGVNVRPRIFAYYPSLYLMGTLGSTVGNTYGTWGSKDTNVASYMFMTFSAGLQLQFAKHFALYTQLNVDAVFDAATRAAFQFGVAF